MRVLQLASKHYALAMNDVNLKCFYILSYNIAGTTLPLHSHYIAYIPNSIHA